MFVCNPDHTWYNVQKQARMANDEEKKISPTAPQKDGTLNFLNVQISYVLHHGFNRLKPAMGEIRLIFVLYDTVNVESIAKHCPTKWRVRRALNSQCLKYSCRSWTLAMCHHHFSRIVSTIGRIFLFCSHFNVIVIHPFRFRVYSCKISSGILQINRCALLYFPFPHHSCHHSFPFSCPFGRACVFT